jgi:hypothetical protein
MKYFKFSKNSRQHRPKFSNQRNQTLIQQIFRGLMPFIRGKIWPQGNHREALKVLPKAMSNNQDPQWDRYVGATMAHIKGDRAAFDQNAAGENYNRDAINRLQAAWGQPYHKAYLGDGNR